MSIYYSFEELRKSDPEVVVEPDPQVSYDTGSVGQWGVQVRALRDWLMNKALSWLWTTMVRPMQLEKEPGQFSITGEPEEVLRTTHQRPALFPKPMLEKIAAWEIAERARIRRLTKGKVDRPVYMFGRPWYVREIKRKPGCVYPQRVADQAYVEDENGSILGIIGVPGFEDQRLDGTGMLKSTGVIFRWLGAEVRTDSYDEVHSYMLQFPTMTVIRQVPVTESHAFLRRMQKVGGFMAKRGRRLTTVKWVYDEGTQRALGEDEEKPRYASRCRVNWHWRLAAAPQIIEDEDLSELRAKLDELEAMLSITTLDHESGELVKVGSAYDIGQPPDVPLELCPTAASVPTMNALDPYDVHMFKTEEHRTIRERTEARQQLFHTTNGAVWKDVYDFGYPEHDVDSIAPGGGFWPEADEYDTRFIPAYGHHARDSEVTDKPTVNVTRVWLIDPKGKEIHLGDQRTRRSAMSTEPTASKNWYRHRMELCTPIELQYIEVEHKRYVSPFNPIHWKRGRPMYKVGKSVAAVSWPDFHDALAWLALNGQCETHLEWDNRLNPDNEHVIYKAPGLDQVPEVPGRMPKWAADQALWINTDSEGKATKARIFGVPVNDPHCYRLMKGKPLAVYQVGFVTWDGQTIWRPARKARVIQKCWVNATIKVTEDLCWELGLDPTLGEGWMLKFNVMNEFAARMAVKEMQASQTLQEWNNYGTKMGWWGH